MAKLPEKRRKFVEAYTGPAQGNATEAARMAGYAKPMQEGHRLLRIAEVAAAVDKIRGREQRANIADRAERQAFLTQVIRGEVEDARASDRTKAVEILGKMQGDFIEKHHVTHQGQASVVFYPDNGRGPAPDDADE